MTTKKIYWSASCAFFLSVLIAGCGAYDGVESENGRMAILDQANLFLNSAHCDDAINLIRPLYESSHVDTEIRMTYASAYACKAQFSFPTVLAAFKDTGTNIYATLVKAMYSTGTDGNLANYRRAAQLLRETSTVAGSTRAVNRGNDANVYMIMMQTGILSTVISTIGLATRATGLKTVTITSQTRTADQQCAAQVALATLSDSLSAIGSNATFSSLSGIVTTLCTGVTCTNIDPTFCSGDAATQALGDLILLAIDTQW